MFNHRAMRALCCIAALAIGQAASANDSLRQLASASSDNIEASALCKELQANPETELINVLSAMKDTSAVAKNWYLSVAQTVADRDPAESRAKLAQFLPRLSEDPTARFWAFEFLTRGNDQLREQLLESMLADPSLELRFEAVKLRLGRLADNDALDASEQIAQCEELLSASRLPTQVQEIAKKLEALEVDVDLLKHFGFIPKWNVCASFDNVKGVGFDASYPPEQMFASGKLKLDGRYPGKDKEASWQELTTKEADGSLDLNPVFEKEKGAVAYAFSTFNAVTESECEVRIGSPNACKVWLNGEEVISREVYHTGSQIDQYTAPVTLKAGQNEILVKLCQNEQNDPWAQEWTFQMRFTDATGLAIQPAAR